MRNWSNWIWNGAVIVVVLVLAVPVLISTIPVITGTIMSVVPSGVGLYFVLALTAVTITIGLVINGTIHNTSHTGSIWVARIAAVISVIFSLFLLYHISVYGWDEGLKRLTANVQSIPGWFTIGFLFIGDLVMLTIAGACVAAAVTTKKSVYLLGTLAALFIWWIGLGNTLKIGENLGEAAAQNSSYLNESGPLPTVGKIEIPRVFGNPTVFALADTYRRLDVPPGYAPCYDPVHKVQLSPDSTPAISLAKSATGNVEHIHIYYVPYGDSCVL